MYQGFFGLREKPFALPPNTAFLVRLAPYQACLNLLRVALGDGEGFIKVSGEVGTGKTLLCRALLNALSADAARWQVAWLPNPGLGPRDLRQALAHELHIGDAEQLDDHSLLAALNQRLIELAAAGKHTVLLIDEAQALPPRTLEALRLLTNLETEHRKLLQVVLFGQPELDELLERAEFRQLRQRITFSYRLRPLDLADTRRYVEERLVHAGYRGEPLFDGRALRCLVSGSGGIPRLINVLAHKALMVAFGAGSRQVRGLHVQRALEDTEGARSFLRQGSMRFHKALMVAFGAGSRQVRGLHVQRALEDTEGARSFLRQGSMRLGWFLVGTGVLLMLLALWLWLQGWLPGGAS